MRTVRRLFYTDIATSVLFVALAFLALFFFIDFVDELADVGKRGYTALHAAWICVLEMPGHLYELAPIAVLIGTIYALARMAQSSEFTILRTGGLGPGRALSLLAGAGLAFGVLTFLVGDYLAPLAEQHATSVRAGFSASPGGGRNAGAWLKDRRSTAQGEQNVAVNIAHALNGRELQGVRIYEFAGDGSLRRELAAASAQVEGGGAWRLQDVQVVEWPAVGEQDEPSAPAAGASAPSAAVAAAASAPAPSVIRHRLAALDWQTGLSAEVVAAAVLPLTTMSTTDLWRYIGHLAANDQAAQRQEIQFWRRALYPFACLVMVALALPFAYLHARNGGISLKIFGGIMLGISFVLLNNLAGHLGLLRQWTPWIAAAVPSLLYLVLSLAAFAWLVRFR